MPNLDEGKMYLVSVNERTLSERTLKLLKEVSEN